MSFILGGSVCAISRPAGTDFDEVSILINKSGNPDKIEFRSPGFSSDHDCITFRAPREQIATLWALNGAFSVLGSTLAVALSMTWGFSWALLAGAALYLLMVGLARVYLWT